MAIAEEFGARLIVMGAYGKRGWREFLLGSTTDRLLAHASRPLFIHH
jgi:nucleotide-binding universal stress UspA family protein